MKNELITNRSVIERNILNNTNTTGILGMFKYRRNDDRYRGYVYEYAYLSGNGMVGEWRELPPSTDEQYIHAVINYATYREFKVLHRQPSFDNQLYEYNQYAYQKNYTRSGKKYWYCKIDEYGNLSKIWDDLIVPSTRPLHDHSPLLVLVLSYRHSRYGTIGQLHIVINQTTEAEKMLLVSYGVGINGECVLENIQIHCDALSVNPMERTKLNILKKFCVEKLNIFFDLNYRNSQRLLPALILNMRESIPEDTVSYDEKRQIIAESIREVFAKTSILVERVAVHIDNTNLNNTIYAHLSLSGPSRSSLSTINLGPSLDKLNPSSYPTNAFYTGASLINTNDTYRVAAPSDPTGDFHFTDSPHANFYASETNDKPDEAKLCIIL